MRKAGGGAYESMAQTQQSFFQNRAADDSFSVDVENGVKQYGGGGAMHNQN